jgi:serine phosphatase RsbU (regulator of sigma subunit)
MAAQPQVPAYYGFRVYFTSNLLYSFLVIPFLIFIIGQNLPDIADRKGWMDSKEAALADSLARTVIHPDSVAGVTLNPDSIEGIIDSFTEKGADQIDSMIKAAAAQGGAHSDTARISSGHRIAVHKGKEEDPNSPLEQNGSISVFFKWLFFLTLASYLAGFIYNMPFKRYFRRIRSSRPAPEKSHAYCKKQLLKLPVVNAVIVALPGILLILYNFFFVILGDRVRGTLEQETFTEFFLLILLATLLEFLFVYYWQRHRVHIRYIEHVFSGEELRERIRSSRGGRIRNRLLIASTMTTFLPLLIVMAYLIESLTRIRNLGMEELSAEAWEILMGPWGTMLGVGKDTFSLEKIDWMPYVNAADTFSMIVGISSGIIVSFIYLLLFIRWTNQDITHPVKELLYHIRHTRGGGKEQYALVRANDEIGELAEGYNEMTRKIHEHMEQIFTMNRDLEQTVEERTQQVVMQKEEIEAQKEEIQAQLDMATQQRDTIGRQKEQILDSIRYAKRLQSALLPPSWYLTETVSDHFILFQPRDIVSGDYYWTSFREGKLLVAVADCTGHGVPGAFLSVLGISSMNEIINRPGSLHASEILEQLRDIVIHTLHQTGIRDEARDGIEIALCVIDPLEKSLEFAGANRPMYLVRQPSGKRRQDPPELIHYHGDKMPIGIYQQDPAPFTNHTVKLRKNDHVYLFSDGYTDQLGGTQRKTFRAVHFRELLIRIHGKSMEEQKKALLEEHETWRGDVEQIDDILVVGIRI